MAGLVGLGVMGYVLFGFFGTAFSAEEVRTPAEDEVPIGMVYVPGGTTLIGSEDGLPAEQPVFEADVDGFFLDQHLVSVGQYQQFVEATEYTTEAEVFESAALVKEGGWQLVAGANWRQPFGAGGPDAPDDHPVTQVSWNDAEAYCAWADKRLPTEVEWEHAARGAENNRQPYSWGDDLVVDGEPRANTWQGSVPIRSTGADEGEFDTSPVGAYGENALGLTDMGGNVWEWVDDWYRSYEERDASFTPGVRSEKVQRGGSFLCHESYCHGYRVSARGHASPESALFHVGFRCAMDY